MNMQPPPLSPLALDGSGGLDGWEEDFDDVDFEDIFKDVEQPDQAEDKDQVEDQVDIGDDGGSSSIAVDDIDLRSLSEASPTDPNINAAAVIEEADVPALNTATTAATAWSTTSLSEESDDGSRSSMCGSSCALGGVSPASGPTPVVARRTSTGSSSVEIPPPAPRSVASEAMSTSTANNDTASVNSKRLLSVSSGAGTPILPFTFAPAFGQTSSSSLTGLHAAALAAAGKLFGHGAPSPLPGSVEAAASTPSRLLGLGRGCGEKEEGTERAKKRTKREERLMKNREAANRSRVKVRKLEGGRGGRR